MRSNERWHVCYRRHLLPPAATQLQPRIFEPNICGSRVSRADPPQSNRGPSLTGAADEVGTARTLRERRKATDALVAKHGGRLMRTTGDGVLLEFHSVVDAVEYAVTVPVSVQ